MDIKYGFSPIIEAICEFRFESNPNWDLTTPGILYEKIKEKFPIKESKQGLPQAIEIKLGKNISTEIKQISQILFFSENRKIFVNIGLSSISIHCIKPYPKWDVFRPNIEFSYKALLQIVDSLHLKRIGLRYLNQIEINEGEFILSDYFEFRPFLGERLPVQVKDFIIGCEAEFLDGRDLCRFQLLTERGAQTKKLFNLDIDYFIENEQALSKINPLDWIEEAHQNSSNIFEGILTEKTKELFKKKAAKK